jgi:HEAT repeat protein
MLNKLLAASCLIAWTLFFPRVAAAPGGEREEEPAYMGRPLRQWILDLKDADTGVRDQAAYTLSRMGPKIRPAFAALKIAVKDTDSSVRQYATEALGNTGPQALPVLLELLESEQTRYGAMMGLQRMQPDAFPELVKRLAEGEPRQRRAAAAALYMSMNYQWRQSGDVLPALRQALKDPDALVRIEAMKGLRATRQQQSIPLDFVVELLKNKDADVRLHTLLLLLENAARLDSEIPALEKLLDDPDLRVRISAAGIVGRHNSERSMAMLAVAREGLKDADEAVRERALSAIYQIVHENDDAIRAALPDVVAFLGNHKRQPKKLIQIILWNLSTLEPPAKDIVPVLTAMARDAEPELRDRAARLLAQQYYNDPAVKSVLPPEIQRVPQRVRLEATAILLTLNQRPKNLLGGLVDALQNPSRAAYRSMAANVLGEMGPEAKEAVPALCRALEDKSPVVRQSALLAILHIEPDRMAEWVPHAIRAGNMWYRPPSELIQTLQTHAGDVLPVLVQGLKDPDPPYRIRAGLLLNQIATVRSVVPDLRVALENKDPAVRILAATALARINPQTEGIASVLRTGIVFNDYAVREQVCQAMRSMGPAAREFAPELVRIVGNKNEGAFRSQAAFALQSIGLPPEEASTTFAAMAKDKDPRVRSIAFQCLSRIKLNDKALLKSFVDQFHENAEDMQQYELFDVIRSFGPAASEELSKRLNDKNPVVRAAFLNLYLATGGANHDELYTAIDRALKDDALKVRLTAANHLVGMNRDSNEALTQVLPVVKECLESGDFAVRQQAIGVLSNAAGRNSRGKALEEIISLLVEQAKAKDAGVRASALNALGSIRPQPKELKPILTQALEDQDTYVRRAAIYSLSSHRECVKEVVPTLIKLLKTKDELVRDGVVYTLAEAGREDPTAIAALLEYYRKLNPGSHMRRIVLSALAQSGGNAKDVISLCLDALKDDNDLLKQVAIQTLMKLDPANKVLVSALVDNARERDLWIGPQHARQMPLGAQVVKELCEILANDKDAGRRAGAARVLGTMVQDAKSAEEALKSAMKDAHPRVRFYAANAYWLVMMETNTPMSVLLATLKEKDIRLRQEAAQVIAEMGKEASPAIPQLVAALKDQDDRVAATLIRAISLMGKEAAPAIPVLVDIVRDGGDSQARSSAAHALMPFGREAKDAVPGLLNMLKSGGHNRGSAAMALAKIATPAEALPGLLEVFVQPTREFERDEHAVDGALIQFGPDAFGPVAELLQHKRAEVRIRAINVLVQFRKQAQSAVPQIMVLMDDKDEDVALSAAEAVWSIDRRTEALPHFVRSLKAKTANNRIRAARNLGNMGPDAQLAVPELVAACKDRNSSVRREAYQALSSVDNETARKLGDPEADGK